MRGWLGGRKTAVWLYTPMMLELAEAFGDAPLVFDCMDDLASFAFAPPEMRARERTLLARAGLMFAGGRSLFEKPSEAGQSLKLYRERGRVRTFRGRPDGGAAPALRTLSRARTSGTPA